MKWWMILALAMGCGGGEGGESGVASGSTSGSTSSGSTSETTGTPTTWECNEWYPCQECGGDHCGAEISACAGDGACGAALNAWAGCMLDCEYPRGCADTFAANGGSAADALLTCTEGSCASECDL